MLELKDYKDKVHALNLKGIREQKYKEKDCNNIRNNGSMTP